MANKSPAFFLREVKTELDKVIWPTRKETLRLTLIVIGVSLSMALFIGLIDYIFTNLLTLFLTR